MRSKTKGNETAPKYMSDGWRAFSQLVTIVSMQVLIASCFIAGLAGCKDQTQTPPGREQQKPAKWCVPPEEGIKNREPLPKSEWFVPRTSGVLTFKDGVSRNMDKISSPWKISRVDPCGIDLMAPVEALGIRGNGNDYHEQKYVGVGLFAPGTNIFQHDFDRARKGEGNFFPLNDEYKELGDEYQRYVGGIGVEIVSKDKSVVATCRHREVKSLSLPPNAYCIALIYTAMPREMIVVSFPTAGISHLTQLAKTASELSLSLIVE